MADNCPLRDLVELMTLTTGFFMISLPSTIFTNNSRASGVINLRLWHAVAKKGEIMFRMDAGKRSGHGKTLITMLQSAKLA